MRISDEDGLETDRNDPSTERTVRQGETGRGNSRRSSVTQSDRRER